MSHLLLLLLRICTSSLWLTKATLAFQLPATSSLKVLDVSFSLLQSASSPEVDSRLGGTGRPLNKHVDDFDDFEFIEYYTRCAIQQRGTESGLEALRILSRKSQQRIPYVFDDEEHTQGRKGAVVKLFPKLLPKKTTRSFLEKVRDMEKLSWISTNPDSVDGLPSLHLNLVSDGQPLVQSDPKNDFERGLQELLSLVEDPIYNILLPYTRQLLKNPSIQVSDIFLRRYGKDVCENMSRQGISAHYDVFSRVTSVIALDDVARDGRNGLFTTYLARKDGSTSNHAALRRFFPLECGDSVVHTWDILHGVDIEPHLDRTSLIVWFTQGDNGDKKKFVAPWLSREGSTSSDDLADFVLASALSSLEESGLNPEVIAQERIEHPTEKELYLRSARSGNTFALTRIGSLIEEGALDKTMLKEAQRTLNLLKKDDSAALEPFELDRKDDSMFLAMQFWLEGAFRGNPLAQQTLADELMVQASETGEEDLRVLAAMLFALAAQQGVEQASDSLSKVVDFDLFSRNVEDEESFLASPVVQIAQATFAGRHHDDS